MWEERAGECGRREWGNVGGMLQPTATNLQWLQDVG